MTVRRTRIGIYSTVCVLAVLLGIWLYQGSDDAAVTDSNADTASQESLLDNASSSSEVAESPFSIKDPVPVADDVLGEIASGSNEQASQTPVLNETPDNVTSQPVDISALGRSALGDQEFLAFAEHFRNDPAQLQQLIDEFRQETDPTRKAALSKLLGEIGGADVTLAASELVFSGDPESRRIGLELLQAVQPGNAEARNIASTLLATEVEPGVLVDTLTTLARPGTVDDGTRQYLSDQIAFLADHDSEKVRSVSLNILSRWNKNGQYTEVIRGGLTDDAAVVRESAAYALVGHKNVNQTLIDSLLSVAINDQELEQARRGAVLALKGMPITDFERQQVMDAELDMDTVRR